MFPVTAKTICFGGSPPVSPLLSTHCQLLLSIVGKRNNNIIKPKTFFCLRKLNAVHRPKQICFYSREFICFFFSVLIMSKSLWPRELQHTRPLCPSTIPSVCPSSWSLHQWYHLAISSFVTLFSSCLQSFPASGPFPVSQFFVSGGQSIGASASASVLPVNIQSWLSLGWTGWIVLLS